MDSETEDSKCACEGWGEVIIESKRERDKEKVRMR
jgi:hypothetical protein